MPVERRGRDHKHFMELMGKGVLTGFGPKPVKQDSPTPKQETASQSLSPEEQAQKDEILKRFDEHSPATMDQD